MHGINPQQWEPVSEDWKSNSTLEALLVRRELWILATLDLVLLLTVSTKGLRCFTKLGLNTDASIRPKTESHICHKRLFRTASVIGFVAAATRVVIIVVAVMTSTSATGPTSAIASRLIMLILIMPTLIVSSI